MDKEDQGNARTRRAEIVALIGSDHLGTVVADIFLISHAGIARAEDALLDSTVRMMRLLRAGSTLKIHKEEFL